MEVIPIVPPNKARKRVVQRHETKREQLKQKRYSAPGLPKMGTCRHNRKQKYQCQKLNSSDVFHFHKNFYITSNKIEQDNYILNYCKTLDSQRKRPRNNSRPTKRMSVQYYVRKYKSAKLVNVCKQAFMDILRINPTRLRGVLMRHHETGLIARERRGGDRKEFEFRAKKEAVQKFMQRFRTLEVHYTRGKDRQRIYLDPSLSISKMYRLYSDQASPGMSVTHSFFRKIFTRCFNIGFGTPRQDVCSICLQLKEKMKYEKSAAEKLNLMTTLRIHKLRAEAFFNKLREEKDDMITLSFDCQKNLPLPKVPDQATYYSRQLYLYNFTVVIGSSYSNLNKNNVKSYLWTEDITAKSANEICSAVQHCLNTLNLENVRTIRLMADGYGGQNKNSFLIGMASKWLSEAPLTLKTIEIIFPVTGHSFLPADRVFALTEKKKRKLESIIEPREYCEIIAEHAEIFNLGTDMPVYDFRSAVKDTLKNSAQWHFQISKIKRVILRRGKTTRRILARGEISYQNDTGIGKVLLRATKNYGDMVPTQMSLGIAVKDAKLKDVRNLLEKHYGTGWTQMEHLTYYKNVLERDPNSLEVRESDECCEHELEEILNFV